MKKKPEFVTYFSSKNSLSEIYNNNDNDNDTTVNIFDSGDNIQDEQFELSTALSISVNEAFVAFKNIQNTDNILPSDFKVQLIALQKKSLCSNYNDMNLNICIIFKINLFYICINMLLLFF